MYQLPTYGPRNLPVSAEKKRAPEVTCIIVNWNKPDITLTCVRSLLTQKYKNFRIFVIDNGSENNLWRELLRAMHSLGSFVLIPGNNPGNNQEVLDAQNQNKNKRLYLIRRSVNGGYAAGINTGVRISLQLFPNTRYFLILNNDLVLTDPHLLDRLVQLAQQHNNEVIICPCIRTIFHEHVHAERKIWNIRKIGNTVCKTGAAFFVPTNVFEHVGLLDERYFLYFEDADFFERAEKQGIACIPLENSGILHKLSSTTGGILSPIALYYSTRNKIRFIKHNRRGIKKMAHLAYALSIGALLRLVLLLAYRRLDLLPYFLQGYLDGVLGKTGKGSIKF